MSEEFKESLISDSQNHGEKEEKKTTKSQKREEELQNKLKMITQKMKKIEMIDSEQIKFVLRKKIKDKLPEETSKADKFNHLMMKFYEKDKYMTPFHFFLKKCYAIYNVDMLNYSKKKYVRNLIKDRQGEFDYAFHQY